MKRNLTSILLITAAYMVSAQTPIINWQQAIGGDMPDMGSSIIQSNDGNFYVAGITESGNGDITDHHGGAQDAWVIKRNAVGGIVWKKAFGGSGTDAAISMIQNSNNELVFLGATNSNDGGLIANSGSMDMWLVALNSSGNMLWQKSFGGSSHDYGKSLIQTSDGGYVIIGESYSNNGDVIGNHGSADIWMAKLDVAGNIQWQKALGGFTIDIPMKIIQTADGGYAIAGYTASFYGDFAGNHGEEDGLIIKLDSTGDIQWQKIIGGTKIDNFNSIIELSTGGYIIAGSTSSDDGDVTANHGGDSDAWVVRLGSTGNLIWQKNYGGSGLDTFSSIVQNSDQTFTIIGETGSNNGDVTGNHGSSDVWLVNINTTGNIQWQKTYGGSRYETASSIIKTNDGNYAFTGSSNSYDGDVTMTTNHNQAYLDIWTVKLKPNTILSISDMNNTLRNGEAYPNPVNRTLTIPDITNGILKVHDMQGRLIQNVSIQNHNVDLNNLQPGTYTVQAQDNKSPEKIIHTKIIKK